MLKSMMEVLIGDLSKDPKAYKQMRLLWPEWEDGVGAGKSASFCTKKISNQFRGIETRSTVFVTSLLRNNGYANINCPQTWECESGAFFCSYPPLFYASFLVLAQASSHSELKSCIEKQLEVGIMLKPHVWLISTLFSFRSSEWVPLVCDLHSYRVYSVLYCEIKHCQSTIIYKCIYLHVDYCSIFTFHVYLTLDCTQWDKVDYSELYFALHVQCWSIAFTDCGEQRLRSSLCTCWLHYSCHTHTHSHTHTHTHTHTHWERESQRSKASATESV